MCIEHIVHCSHCGITRRNCFWDHCDLYWEQYKQLIKIQDLTQQPNPFTCPQYGIEQKEWEVGKCPNLGRFCPSWQLALQKQRALQQVALQQQKQVQQAHERAMAITQDFEQHIHKRPIIPRPQPKPFLTMLKQDEKERKILKAQEKINSAKLKREDPKVAKLMNKMLAKGKKADEAEERKARKEIQLLAPMVAALNQFGRGFMKSSEDKNFKRHGDYLGSLKSGEDSIKRLRQDLVIKKPKEDVVVKKAGPPPGTVWDSDTEDEGDENTIEIRH
ncbi:hypothetical protein G7046_g5394 [Stylonectria norvegica]|nr:hypothetical protein G7046_g5394 [Stylonectria norvegica]